jgi:cation diffusion facilitator family transporter
MLSFGVGVVMFLLKTGAYFITNSAAILSDAMESVVHVIATGIALYSIVLVGRPADRKHPYGYGKVEYFSAGIEGALIVLAAIAICYQAVADLIGGSHLKSLDVGAWAVGSAGAINLLLGIYLIRTGRRTNSLVLIADGKHVLTDSYTSIGVLVGVMLVEVTGITILDPLFAIAVALNIIYTGYDLVGQSIRGLMNTADLETLGRIVDVVNQSRTDEMIDLYKLRAWSSGEQRFIDFHLTLPYYLPLQRSRAIGDALHDVISDAFDGQAEVMLHLDPCSAVCCAFCPKPDCSERQGTQGEVREFTVANAQGEPIYKIMQRGAGE